MSKKEELETKKVAAEPVAERVSFRLRKQYGQDAPVTLSSRYKTAKQEGARVVSVETSEADRLRASKLFEEIKPSKK